MGFSPTLKWGTLAVYRSKKSNRIKKIKVVLTTYIQNAKGIDGLMLDKVNRKLFFSLAVIGWNLKQLFFFKFFFMLLLLEGCLTQLTR